MELLGLVNWDLITKAGTLLVAAVSAWMAWETRRIASVDRLPLLGMQDLRSNCIVPTQPALQPGAAPPAPSVNAFRLGVVLFNAGRVPVVYERKAMHMDCANTIASKPVFRSNTGTIMPGSSIVYWYDYLVFTPPLAAFPATGHLTFEFAYGAKGKDQLDHTLKHSLEFVLTVPSWSTHDVQWFYSDA
jgi:hypothetical protein